MAPKYPNKARQAAAAEPTDYPSRSRTERDEGPAILARWRPTELAEQVWLASSHLTGLKAPPRASALERWNISNAENAFRPHQNPTGPSVKSVGGKALTVRRMLFFHLISWFWVLWICNTYTYFVRLSVGLWFMWVHTEYQAMQRNQCTTLDVPSIYGGHNQNRLNICYIPPALSQNFRTHSSYITIYLLTNCFYFCVYFPDPVATSLLSNSMRSTILDLIYEWNCEVLVFLYLACFI